MLDMLLSGNDREEALSRAYVQTVAAGGGYVTSTMDFDRDGVDLHVRAGGAMRPCLDIQLKATINLGEALRGTFRYALKRRNYDLLREAAMVPRILVLLALPRNENEWLDIDANAMILRKCAYWASPAGWSETSNQDSVTISLNEADRFDVPCLRALMSLSRTGAIT